MNEDKKVIKCPRCGQKLTELELEKKVCFTCGALFTVNFNSGNVKKRGKIINDARNMNYYFWLRFFVFLFTPAAILAAFGVFIFTFSFQQGVFWFVLVISVFLYAIIFTFYQFLVNLIRDIYILKAKILSLEDEKPPIVIDEN